MRRRTRKEQSTDLLPERATEMAEPADDSAILESEIAKLPEGQRVAVVLCEIEGLSRAQAATRLGIAEGTLSSRLANARKQLALRLRERGIAPALAFATLTAVPPALSAATIQSATHSAVMLAPTVAKLTREALHMMFLSKLKLATVAVVCACALWGGFGGGQATESPAKPGVVRRTNAPVPKAVPPEGVILVSRNNRDEPDKLVEVLETGGKSAGYLALGKLDNVRQSRVSPDGKRLAFIRFIPLKGTDGNKVMYAYPEDLYVVDLPLAGPPKEPVLKGLVDPAIAWSADGKSLFISSIPKEIDAEQNAIHGKTIPSKIVRFDIASQKETPIDLPAGHSVQDASPDGKTLLTGTKVWNRKAGSYSTFTVPLDTLKPTRIGDEDDGFALARFSPDGTQIAGIRTRYSLSKELGLFVCDTAKGKVENIPLPKEIADDKLDSLAWAPDSNRLALLWRGAVAAGGRKVAAGGPGEPAGGMVDAHRVSVLDVAGRSAKTIREYPPDQWHYQLEWAAPKLTPADKPGVTPKRNAPVPKPVPREGVILISSFNDDKPLEIVKPDGTGSRIIKPEERSRPHSAKLSPDGKRVVYADLWPIVERPVKFVMFSIRMLDLEAVKPVPKIIVEEAYYATAVWAPDGKSIYYSILDVSKYEESQKQGEKILFETFQYDPVTDKRTQLKLPAEQAVIGVSPDGKTLLTKTTEFGTYMQTIFLTPTKTLKPELSHEFPPVSLDGSAFSPDGKYLIRQSATLEEVPQLGIVIVELATKKERPIPLPKEALGGPFAACWSPDGKRIAYQWFEEIPQPAGVPIPVVPGAKWSASRVTVCDLDGSNSKVIVKREYNETIMGLDWR